MHTALELSLTNFAIYTGEITLSTKETVHATYQGAWKSGKWHDKCGILTLIGIGTFSGKFENGKFLEGTSTYNEKPPVVGKVRKWAYTAQEGTMQRTDLAQGEKTHIIDLKTGITRIGSKILSETSKRACTMQVVSENEQLCLGSGKISYKQAASIYETYEGGLKFDKASGKIVREGEGTITIEEVYLKRHVHFRDDEEVKTPQLQ